MFCPVEWRWFKVTEAVSRQLLRAFVSICKLIMIEPCFFHMVKFNFFPGGMCSKIMNHMTDDVRSLEKLFRCKRMAMIVDWAYTPGSEMEHVLLRTI